MLNLFHIALMLATIGLASVAILAFILYHRHCADRAYGYRRQAQIFEAITFLAIVILVATGLLIWSLYRYGVFR